MSSYELALDRRAKEIEWGNDTCDQYDYRIAAFCGLAAGVIDALFVGAPGQGALGRLTDKGADGYGRRAFLHGGQKPSPFVPGAFP